MYVVCVKVESLMNLGETYTDKKGHTPMTVVKTVKSIWQDFGFTAYQFLV